MDDLCTACLCSGRTLIYIDETEFYHVYSLILGEISLYDASEVCVRLCWECVAALQRFQRFKRQAAGSYARLLEHKRRGDQEQPTKLLEKAPRLQSKLVISIDYPDIKTEVDSLDINFDDQHCQEFDQVGQSLDQDTGQNFVIPLAREFDHQNQSDVTRVDNLVKEEDHNDLETFVNNLDVKKKPERKKKDNKIDKTKVSKVKKNKLKLKKTTKLKKKKQKLENKVKSDVESGHEFEDDYLSPFENKDKLEKEDVEQKVKKTSKIKKKRQRPINNEIKSDAESCHEFEDSNLSPLEDKKEEEIEKLEELDSKECDIYQTNELEVEFENSETAPPSRRARTPRTPRAARPARERPAGGGGGGGGGESGAGDKPQCAECGKVFSSRKTLRYHLNVLHKGNNRHPCPRCGKVYQWKSNLGRHLRSHKARDSGELYCATCDKRFASVATYRQHLSISKQHVSESQFSFSCESCGKKFVSRTRLRDHVDWEHLHHIKFRCQLCNKPFKCHTSLYVHMKNVHREKGLKDNLCHVCGKSYQNAAKLRYHIVAMHTTQTPYQCEQCTAAFGWYSSLYRHVREVHYKMKVHPSKTKKTKKRPEPIPPHTHTHTHTHTHMQTHTLPPPLAPPALP